jgi:hypothetical protein
MIIVFLLYEIPEPVCIFGVASYGRRE